MFSAGKQRVPLRIVKKMGDITLILRAIEGGDANGPNALLVAVYDELRLMAAGHMGREMPGQTLQPTALVHEAWLRLGGDQQPNWKNRAHFFGAAGEAMRRILIDRARRRLTVRHGGDLQRVAGEALDNVAAASSDERLLAVDEALAKFAAIEPKKAELVKLRYFVGLTNEEAARALEISKPTAKRWWSYARAWLHTEIGVNGR